MVLSQVGQIVHLQTQAGPGGSVTAAIVFLDPRLAQVAAKQFHGALADGMVLQTEVRRLEGIQSWENLTRKI